MDFDSFKEKYHIRLSAQQEEAVLRDSGETLVLAVPGSGKTTTIVARVGYLIYCLGIDPASIVTITYSKAASIEMRDRFLAVFGTMSRMPKFSTIHSMCVSILQHASRVHKYHIPTLEPETPRIIRSSLFKATAKWPQDQLVDRLTLLLTKAKNQMMTKEELKEVKCAELKEYDGAMTFSAFVDLYEDYKKANDLMDFDDQLKFALDILEDRPEVLENFHKKYRHIGVDEAQDTSWLQYSIIRTVARGMDSLFVVGDDDQSIYGFRGAEPQNLLSFTDDYPFAKVLYMETNYRSGREIVQAADRFISANHIRYEKKAVPARAEDGRIDVVRMPSETAMYEKLYRAIKQAAVGPGHLAIIARNNYMFLPLVVRLDKEGIAVRRRDNFDAFFNSPAVQGALAYLRLAIHPDDVNALKTISGQAKLYIRKEQMEKIQRIAEDNESSQETFDAIECAKTVCAADDYVVKRLDNLRETLRIIRFKIPAKAVWIAGDELGRNWNDESDDAASCSSNYLEMLSFTAENYTDIEKFLTAMERYAKGGNDLRGVDSNITLTTVHSSKGLEFEEVILIEAFAGVMPPHDISKLTDIEAEEEARLFYVAATRAKDHVRFFIPDSFLRKPVEESPYIRRFTGKTEAPREEPKKKHAPPKKADAQPAPKPPAPLRVGDIVIHKSFGRGTVRSVDRDILSVDFDKIGRKRLLAAFCERDESDT